MSADRWLKRGPLFGYRLKESTLIPAAGIRIAQQVTGQCSADASEQCRCLVHALSVVPLASMVKYQDPTHDHVQLGRTHNPLIHTTIELRSSLLDGAGRMPTTDAAAGVGANLIR